MKLKRKLLAVITAAATVFSLCACSSESGYSNSDSGKLKIISTVFPPYDLARQIAGDNAEISILLPPGSEIHNYEPSAKDMIAIRNCDIFLYIGGENEQWAEKLINSNDTENVTAVKLIDYVPTLSEDEDEHDHDHDHDHEHEHEHETDEHIWTSPVMAQKLVENICHNLSEKMPEYKDVFNKNSKDYINEIKNVDKEIRSITNKAHKKEIIFADKFPLKYFALEYGLKYYAAFDGCSGEMEPSAKTVAFLIDKVKAKDVFYLELSSQAMADVICDDTGVKKYQFNSCHNITEKQFKEGITYVNLMKENANVLKKALNVK